MAFKRRQGIRIKCLRIDGGGEYAGIPSYPMSRSSSCSWVDVELPPVVGDRDSSSYGSSSDGFGFTSLVPFLPWYPRDPPANGLELSLTLPTTTSRKTKRWPLATCSKTPAFTPSAYTKKMQSFILGLSFSLRVSGTCTCELHPNKKRLCKFGFCPHMASNGNIVPLFKVVDVLFRMKVAIVAAYCQYSWPRPASIMRHLAISMIVLFSLSALPFYYGVRGNDLSHLIPCSLR